MSPETNHTRNHNTTSNTKSLGNEFVSFLPYMLFNSVFSTRYKTQTHT